VKVAQRNTSAVSGAVRTSAARGSGDDGVAAEAEEWEIERDEHDAAARREETASGRKRHAMEKEKKSKVGSTRGEQVCEQVSECVDRPLWFFNHSTATTNASCPNLLVELGNAHGKTAVHTSTISTTSTLVRDHRAMWEQSASISFFLPTSGIGWGGGITFWDGKN
jgi:hypothetical protein